MIHVAVLGREAILLYTWLSRKQGKMNVKNCNRENKKDTG